MISPFKLRRPNTKNIIYSNVDCKQEESIFIRPFTNNGELRYKTAVGDLWLHAKSKTGNFSLKKKQNTFLYSPQKKNKKHTVKRLPKGACKHLKHAKI